MVALTKLENRKDTYKKGQIPFYRPWLVIIAGSRRNRDSSDNLEAKALLAAEAQRRNLFVVGIRVGDIDLSEFNEIAPTHNRLWLRETTLKRLGQLFPSIERRPSDKPTSGFRLNYSRRS